MKKIFTLILFIGSVFSLNAQDCSDIFFSEYVEGSGNSKGIEIYNPTDEIIDLSAYTVIRYSNGGTSASEGYMTTLEGFLEPFSTFVLVNGQDEDIDLGSYISVACDPELQDLADQLDGDYPAPMYMNGNDAIALVKDDNGTSVAVDLFGTIGGNMTSSDEGWTNFTDAYAYKNIYDDDGNITGKDSALIVDYIVPEGYYWLAWTMDHTLIRKSSVREGVKSDPGVFVVTMEWDTLAGGADVWDELGRHDCECAYLSSESIKVDKQSKIFPNPAVTNVLTLSAINEIKEIAVFNTAGAMLDKLDLSRGIMKQDISISGYDAGLYILKIEYYNGSFEEQRFQKIN